MPKYDLTEPDTPGFLIEAMDAIESGCAIEDVIMVIYVKGVTAGRKAYE